MPKNNINSAKVTDSSQSALSQLDFCALLNISADCIESFHISINPAEDYRREIFITLKPSYPLCPICGSRSLIKGFYLRKIKYELLGNHNTVLFHKDRRYQCVSCGKTHFAPSPFTMENSRISISTTLNVLEDLKSPNLTFSECAKKNHISATSVAYIFDSHVDIKRKQLPAFLCIDEVYASVSRKSKYICVLLDYRNREPVDVLESRWKMTLEKYFLNIPREERDSVKVFCSDMYEPYRIVKKSLLPKAIHIVDRFHVAQDFNRLISKYRIKLMNRYPKDSNEYYLLKKFNYLLFQSDESRLDPNAKRQFNRKLNRYCNYYELRDLLLKTDPELERVVNMKDRLYLFYDCHIISEDNTEVPQEAVPELKRNSYGDVSKKSLRAQNEAKKRNSRTRITIEEAYKRRA